MIRDTLEYLNQIIKKKQEPNRDKSGTEQVKNLNGIRIEIEQSIAEIEQNYSVLVLG